MLSMFILLGTFGILGSFTVRQGEDDEMAEWRRVEWHQRRGARPKADWIA